MKAARSAADNLGKKTRQLLNQTKQTLKTGSDQGFIDFGAAIGSKSAPRYVYRGGSRTPGNLTPRPGKDLDGLSTFDSPSLAASAGGKVQRIDTARLRLTRAYPDAEPPGHVSIRPLAPADIPAWAATRGTGSIHPYTQDIIDALVDGIGGMV
jgi:hypothetical protein